jgi:hypothetical protein
MISKEKSKKFDIENGVSEMSLHRRKGYREGTGPVGAPDVTFGETHQSGSFTSVVLDTECARCPSHEEALRCIDFIARDCNVSDKFLSSVSSDLQMRILIVVLPSTFEMQQ